MEEDRIPSPFFTALTSKGNLMLLAVGVFFLVDLLRGSPATLWIVKTTGRVQGTDGNSSVRILTPFGVFTDPRKLARVYDFVGMALPGVILIPLYLHSLYVSLKQRTME